MVSVVTNRNRHGFEPLIADMHRDRKRVFVDALKWNVPVVDDVFEIDQFDTSAAVYLIDADLRAACHRGSVRLLPTTGPHLLGEVFPHLRASSVPVGPTVWEITRLCTSPSLVDRTAARDVRRRVSIAMIEFALLYGLDRLVFVTHAAWVPEIIAIGWDIEPLGLPQRVGDGVTALAINVTPATLALLRDKWGIAEPLLCHDLRAAEAA